ncbi:hypothetical protein HPG69_015621 [Diceros bicornis minor]|uniref:Lipocalin/cytosolic fatty-acid binding domain-containing protein n=1 Tax=Diceros bicornis minor TaxID=77932 RepID=A0A7J7EEG5_DICBM|nr:hypothetical protein HPG69_015621 [Diceros bicornis minor]
MAASDLPLPDSESAPLRVYIQELKPTPEDNLEIILREGNAVCAGGSQNRLPFRESKGCAERKIFAEKTKSPAEFKINYLDENKLFVLDTDYENYLLLCMQDDAAAPAQSLACQYLARTLKVDEEVMEKFDRALKPLPGNFQIIPDQTQMEERCRV